PVYSDRGRPLSELIPPELKHSYHLLSRYDAGVPASLQKHSCVGKANLRLTHFANGDSCPAYILQLIANVRRFSCFARSGMNVPSVPCHQSGDGVPPRPAKYGTFECRLKNSNRKSRKSVGKISNVEVMSQSLRL